MERDDVATPPGSPSDPDRKQEGSSDDTVKTPGADRPSVDEQETVRAPARPRDPLLGAQLGNYKVVSMLGKGGFGTVYRARDVKLGCDRALKFLRELEPEHRKLFEREAKALASLSKHQHIVQIHAWGEHQDHAYFALELVDSSAQKLLAKHPDGVPVATALRVIAESAEALAYAHKQGILHRDIKPGNILIEDDGRAKIADFGLARFYASDQATMSGVISGSPSYMSPEQARGRRLDERTDIYSLGVTLYELLSGKRPFEGETQMEVLELVREGKAIPLRTRRPDLPQPILDVVDKATAYEAADRFESAEDFAIRLNNLLRALEKRGEVSAVPKKKPSPVLVRVGRWVVAAVIVVVLGGILLRGVNDDKDGSLLPAPSALAEANKMLDMGEFNEAEKRYRKILLEEPADDKAIYGLGYSLLHQARTDEAEAEFGKVSAEALRAEGKAAVAYERDPEGARQALESVPTGYPRTLLAALDVSDGQYDSAVERLDAVDSSKLDFNWQRDKYWQTLGQARYRSGNYKDAEDVFDELGKSVSPATASMANAYAELARSRANEERRAALSEQIDKVKQILDEEGYEPPSVEDLWTSRPLVFFLLPPETRKSRLAVESGLADVLPWMLGKALNDGTPMTEVNRELMDEILMEQQLSAQLSSGKGRLALQQVLGARLMIQCSFNRVLEEDVLMIDVVDTETSTGTKPKDVRLSRTIDPDALMTELTTKIWNAVSKKYPLQARLSRGEDGAEIDIGASVGVQEGMQFEVFLRPDPNIPWAGKSVITQGPIGTDKSAVVLDGFKVEDIPQEGSYVIAKRAET